jgi:uncharacterized protein YjbJ (UPF0337 family)
MAVLRRLTEPQATRPGFTHDRPRPRQVQSRRTAMGELNDKTKGLGNQIAGSIKKGVGDITNDPALMVEGDLQKAKGELQNAIGSVQGAAGDKI